MSQKNNAGDVELTEIKGSWTVLGIDFWSANKRRFDLLMPLVKQLLPFPLLAIQSKEFLVLEAL